jgi:nodulation protein E
LKRVVVTGLGCITPIGNSVEEFRESLYAGRTGIAPFDANFPGALSPDPGLRFKTTGKVKNFEPTKNPAQHLTSGVIISADTSAQFGIIAARQAAAESALLQHHDPTTIAIITGCACGGRAADEDANRHLYTRNARVLPTAILRTMASSGTSNIAIEMGITGPVLNISTACASGTHAIGLAFQMVRAGIAPAAITGGYEGPLTFGFLRAWDSMRVVSSTSCRPFALDRDGMTLGEGAAMLTIEPLDAALARGAHIYAEIVGFGMSADAHHITQPRAEGAALAMRRSLQDTATTLGAQGLDAETWASRVGYINAHGTGTPTNDAVEAAAIHQALGEFAPRIPVGATKSFTGHSIGAAGAIEALATVLALDAASLPYTTGVNTVDPALNLDVIIGESRPLAPDKDLALSNSLAFGGLNAVLAFRRYTN